MTRLTELLLAAAIVPLGAAMSAPALADWSARADARNAVILAQAEQPEQERNGDQATDDADDNDRDRRTEQDAAQEALERAAEEEAERAAEEEAERLREVEEEAERQREQAAQEEAERLEQLQEEAERERREAAEAQAEAEAEAERERAQAAEEETRRREAELEAERERAAQEEAERRREAEQAAQEEAERLREAEEEAEREAQRAAEREAEERRAREEEDAAREDLHEPGELPSVGEGETNEERGLRERLRERRARERAAEDAPVSDDEAREEPIEPEAPERERTEEPEERPALGERIRRFLNGDSEPREAEERRPEAEEPRRAEERERRERVRERRQRERADAPERRQRAREAQRDLDEFAEEREDLREEVRELRRQRASELEAIERAAREGGLGEVVQRRDDRVIIRSENNYFIQNNDMRRFIRRAVDIETRRRDRGQTETVIHRRDGSRVITVYDEYGDIILRTRILADGHEIVLIDDRRRHERRRGDRRRRVDYYSQALPPLVIDIPREEYIVETGRASRRDIYRALSAPPVEEVEQAYSLEDVLYNERIRDMVPRVDLDTITFEFDSAEVPDDQIDTLEEIGLALEDIIAENPREVFLLEGHTDWPGSHEYNLALSDRRAENVAIILTEFFDIPEENLLTQGYGKQYLKIDTQEPERRNRRVTARRITDLMAATR